MGQLGRPCKSAKPKLPSLCFVGELDLKRRDNQVREEEIEKEHKEAEEKLEKEWKEAEENLRREYKAKEETLRQEKKEALAILTNRRKERYEQIKREMSDREEQLRRENAQLEEEQMVEMLAKQEAEGKVRKRKVDQLDATNKQPAAPECPVCLLEFCSGLFIGRIWFLAQVCFDEMVPPTKIFHCVNGHHICETCK